MPQKDSFFLPGKIQKEKEANKEEKRNFKKSEYKAKRDKNFDQNRDKPKKEESQEQQKGDKKPFDKKTYRLKKYSKKYKLQQFEEQRKKKLLHKYHKTLKNDTTGTYKPISFDEDTTDSNQQQIGRFVRHPDLIKEDSGKESNINTKRPQLGDKQPVKEDHKDQTVKQAKKWTESEKYAEYKKKKQERFKKLSMKNKKGQPVMASRMELLLEKLRSESDKK